LRFDFSFKNLDFFHPFRIFLLMWPIKIIFLVAFGQFRGLLSFFHMPDLINIFFAFLSSSIVVYLSGYMFGAYVVVPRGALTIDLILSMVLLCSLRMILRIVRERNYKADAAAAGVKIKRAAVLGAGDIGTSIASDLIARKNLGLKPVLFLDDDPYKQDKQILGLNVLPVPKDFKYIKEVYKVNRIVIASKHISPSRISEVLKSARDGGLKVSIVPSTADLADGAVKVSQIREVEIEDILGRKPVVLDSDMIDDMIKNKVVMVTGAGGSIGGELCRQIAAKSPAMLVMVDHCEVQLFQIEQDVLGRGYGAPIKPVVANIVNEKRMDAIMARFKPQIIFHAAAHKHVPMMEYQPSEALRNNSFGTWVISHLASKHGAERFILISTDKAINPTNVMGASKRLAEMFVHSMQDMPNNKTIFSAVRFGNVLGSSGSVIPTFKKQIAHGGPVTVTHPEVTRYFMTIPEAVGLVMQCGAQMSGGEIFVLDMGEPVKIINLAKQLITLSGFRPGVDIELKVTGLRPGEKLFEELQHKDESLIKTKHERIFGFVSERPKHADMQKIAAEIAEIADSKSVNEVKEFIKSKVQEYSPQFYD